MQIDINKNVSFQARVKFDCFGQRNAENPVLRPLIKHLKHHCGGSDIEHYIKVSDTHLGVSTLYIPKAGGKDNFLYRFDIIESNPVTKVNVDKIIADLTSGKLWQKEIEILEKSQVINTVPQEKKSLFAKLFSFSK